MSETLCPSCTGPVDASGVCPKCATHVQSRSATQVTQQDAVEVSDGEPEFPGYKVIRHLGEGGMGAVYLAEDTTLARHVAIKVVSKRVAGDAQSKSRFMREARTMATIEHPHVMRVYSFGESPAGAYLVMEYVDGETLTERIARLGRLPVDEALRVTRQIVEGLDAAWERRVIHRDIKPSNIIFDRRNQVRVADFGLAKPLEVESDASLTLSGYLLGTPHYVSPEQAQGRDVDFRADVYSLGIMLYQMLTGERPFDGTTPIAIIAKHLHAGVPPVRLTRPDVSAGVEQLVQWMTEKDPEQRPDSYATLLDAIDSLTATTPGRTLPSLAALRSTPQTERWWRADLSRMSARARVGAAFAALLGVAVVVVALGLMDEIRRHNAHPEASVAAATDRRLVVAVAPFYGPDEDSVKEGRVMAALIERAIQQRLGSSNARVIGIDETKTAVRNHDAARELGTRLGANAVIWGEAFALRNETEVQPHVTVVRKAKEKSASGNSGYGDRRLLGDSQDPLSALEARGAETLKLQAEAPNQIELRKTTASGIGDVVMLLAGIHALDSEREPKKAIDFFRQAPRSAETLRYEASAFLQLDKSAEAMKTLEQAAVLDPSDGSTQATLGDLYFSANRVPDAVAAYRRAEASGEPYSTSRGLIYGGRLYVKETYSSSFYYNQEATETNYLLALDPDTQRVASRYALPGAVTRLERQGNDVLISYRVFKDAAQTGVLTLRNGTFVEPLWYPANFLVRIKSVKSGKVLAANYLHEIEAVRSGQTSTPKFALAKEPDEAQPRTLPDLERALRAAAERDPTQPWHLFMLAITLDASGRKAEAEAALQEMLRRDYAGIPYYDFTWMMSMAQKMRRQDWSDAVFPKALAQRRRLPQPPTGMVLIERLINTNFPRQAAQNHDMRHAYRALVQARAIASPSLEGEDFAAAAWIKYFREQGDLEHAAAEQRVLDELKASPMNLVAKYAFADYAISLVAGLAVGFALLASLLGSRALRRAKAAGGEWTPLSAVLGRLLQGRWRLVIGAVVVGLLAIGVAWSIVLRLWDSELTFIALLVIFTIWIVRRQRVRFFDVVASLAPRERAMMLFSYVALLIALGMLSMSVARIGRLAAIPIGFGDSLGHAHIVRDFEQRLLIEPDAKTLLFMTALVNHYAGNHERARALYSRIPDEPRAARNLELAIAGKMPPAGPTARDFYHAYVPVPWYRMINIGNVTTLVSGDFVESFTGTLLLGTLILVICSCPFLLMMVIRSRRELVEIELPARPDSMARRIFMLLLPGTYDMRHGSPLRAYGIVVLFTFAAVPLLVTSRNTGGFPAVGLLTSIAVPNISSAFPLPFTPQQDPLQYGQSAWLDAYPYGVAFRAAVVGALVLGLLLHLARIPAILQRRISS